jgi:hypothetical protein
MAFLQGQCQQDHVAGGLRLIAFASFLVILFGDIHESSFFKIGTNVLKTPLNKT